MSVSLNFFTYRLARTVCDPEAAPRGSCSSQEGLPTLCRSQRCYCQENGLSRDNPPRWTICCFALLNHGYANCTLSCKKVFFFSGHSTNSLLFCLFPGNVRNDIYVTLLQGEFDRGKKKTPKNVEVTISVHDEEGRPVEVTKNKTTPFYVTLMFISRLLVLNVRLHLFVVILIIHSLWGMVLMECMSCGPPFI